MKIKEVDDRAETQPIDDIADRAADDEADRDGKKTCANPPEPGDQDEDDHEGGEREDQRIDPGAVKRPKLTPGLQVSTRSRNELSATRWRAQPGSPKNASTIALLA